MPSPYSPPDVIVTQKRRTTLANRDLPQLPVVVVGPARQIEYRAKAGDYTSGDAFQAAVPNLKPGAVIDPSTFKVLLDAKSFGGKQLGLFEIASPDAQLSPEGDLIELAQTFALSYSLLSSRNNNQPNSTSDDDYGAGKPDTVTFTDDTVDFLSLQATANDTDVVINAPASMAGSYRIYRLVGAGTGSNAVKVEKLASVATGVKVVSKSFNITGFANVSGTAVINGSDTDVADVGLVSPGGNPFSIANADYPAAPFFMVPAPTSADQVILSMSGQASNVVNAWNALIAAAQVGDFLRIDQDSIANANGDFKIVALNKNSNTATIIRVGQTGTGTVTAGGGASANMKLLRVLRGRADQNNAAGDIIEAVIGGVTAEFEVESATPTRIVLVSAMTLSAATAVTVRRGIPFRNSVASYDLVKRVTSGYTGSVLVSYEADRNDLGVEGLIPLASQREILDVLGPICPQNPIALMADMVTRSGLTDGTRIFYALVTDGPTLSDYQAAMDVLETEDVYYVVPATQDKAIISLFKAHVDAQSQPANKHERVLIASTGIVSTLNVVPAIAGDPLPTDGIVGPGANLALFESQGIDWSLVNPGDVIKIMSDATALATVIETKRIFSVDIPNKRATVIGTFASDYAGNAQVFKIDSYPFTKQEQAEEWRDYAKSLDDARVLLIRPDLVEITYTDTIAATQTDKDVIVPGYFAAAVFAGLCCANAPQQPMTNVPIPGINRIYHSNTYFTPDQLNTIAEGGNCMLVQDNINAAPYSRHQLTTDMESLLTREFSIIKNVDFASKYIRRSLKPFIGNKNITEEYLTQLRGIAESLIRGLVAAESMLQGTTLEKLYQNPDEPDTVIIEIGLKVPYPANKIYVTLFI